jgi:hypothetical protein
MFWESSTLPTDSPTLYSQIFCESASDLEILLNHNPTVGNGHRYLRGKLTNLCRQQILLYKYFQINVISQLVRHVPDAAASSSDTWGKIGIATAKALDSKPAEMLAHHGLKEGVTALFNWITAPDGGQSAAQTALQVVGSFFGLS